MPRSGAASIAGCRDRLDRCAAIRSGSGTNFTYELTDAHNTATIYLDDTAQTPTWTQTDPYGNSRGSPVTAPDNHGFLNKPKDTNTGLTRIGARNYDPTIGTFTTLDPVLETTDPSQLSGYGYSGSNPIARADPTGLEPGSWCTAESASDCGKNQTYDPRDHDHDGDGKNGNGSHGNGGGSKGQGKPAPAPSPGAHSAGGPPGVVPSPSPGIPPMPVDCVGNCTDPAVSIFENLSGYTDVHDCLADGDALSCTFTALNVVPLFGRGLGKAADAVRALAEAAEVADVVRLGRGVWKLPPLVRGKVIEKALGQNLPDPFPAIDIWVKQTGTATSIKSIDLGAKSYQSASAVARKLKGYVKEVAGFTGGRMKDTLILPGDIDHRVLKVAVPEGATAAQWTAMYNVYQSAASEDVTVTDVVVK